MQTKCILAKIIRSFTRICFENLQESERNVVEKNGSSDIILAAASNES